ncbi:hypothetical protein ACFSQJ_07245 [Croceitalea marina]|uniref:tRNA_anti-like n=1 Tax=Croceitalea marina TaxID=1775166 RepID=A0ABW5MUI4_9FLAO
MKKKNLKYFVIGAIVVGLITGFVIFDKVMNAPHRQISKEVTDFVMPAEDLQFQFANSQETATTKYMDKVIETYGSVTEIGLNHIVLEDKVLVMFLEGLNQEIIEGDQLKIKGRCVGFDELILLVKIDQATTIN